MDMKKFYGAEDAARYAASITDSWQTEDGEVWKADTLIGAAECADGDNPLDEEDTDTYYIVDNNGAVGFTSDDCGDIYWWVTPLYVSASPSPAGGGFCPSCGTKLKPGSRFCPQCGRKL